jgi:TusA-related sulfurtransferase
MELVGKIRQGDAGTVYELQTTDSSSSHDVPEWVDDTGNELLGIDEHDDYWSIFVEKV